jgi:hypothetical protein
MTILTQIILLCPCCRARRLILAYLVVPLLHVPAPILLPDWDRRFLCSILMAANTHVQPQALECPATEATYTHILSGIILVS